MHLPWSSYAALIALLLFFPRETAFAAQQIWTSVPSAAPTTTAVRYQVPVAAGLLSWGTTDASRQVPISAAGTLKNLRVYFPTAPGASKSWTFALMKNGSATSVTCTVAGTLTVCNDSSNTVSLNPGDLVSMRVTPSGTPTSAIPSWSLAFEPTTGSEFVYANSAVVNSLSNTFLPPGASRDATNATENNARFVSPIAGTFKDFIFDYSRKTTLSFAVTSTLRQNGADTALSCAVSGTTYACSDADTVDVAAGDVFSVRDVKAGNNGTNNNRYAFTFVPDTAGYFLLGMTSDASPSGSAVAFLPVQAGDFNPSATESAHQSVSNAMKVQGIAVKLTNAPGSGKTRTFTLRQNGADTALSCTVSNTDTTCSAVAEVIVEDGDLLATETTPLSSPTAPAGISVTYYAQERLPVGITVSGTVYSNKGATPLGNQTVRVAVNGTDFTTTAESNATTGTYSIANVPVFTGSVLTVYLEDETADAVTVTPTAQSNATGLDLYQNRLIARADYGGVITTEDLASAVVSGEADISNIYGVTDGDLTVEDGKELLVWTGDTFAPGGAITAHDIDIDGTLSLGDNAASVSGSWDATGGSVSTSGLVLFTGAGSEIILTDGEAFFNIAFSGAGTWTLEDALDVNGDLTLTAGTLDAKSGENNPITLSGSWITEDGSFTYRSGTVTLDGGDQTLSGTGSFFNLTKIVSVAKTLSFAANMTQSVFGMLTLNGASGNLLGIVAGEVFGTEQTPLQTTMVSDTTDCPSGDYNMGYRFYPTADGVITKLGVQADTGDRVARLFACTNGGCTTGTELASVTVTPTGISSWAYASLDTPVSVTAGQEYVVAVRKTSTGYCRRNFSTNPDVTTDDIVIVESRYISASDALPTTSSETLMYGVADVVFQPQATDTGKGKLVLDGGGSMSLEYLDVQDNDASGGQTLLCLTENGCVDGGGTTNWSFEQLIFATITGTVYSDEGSTPLGNQTVRVAVKGMDFATTAESNATTGVYSIPNVPMSSGSVLTVYLEDETADAVTVDVGAPYGLPSINLYQNRLIARADYGGVITNGDLTTGAVSGEADISNIYGVADGNLTVENGKELLVWTGDAYVPGGAVTTHDIDINGSLNLETNTGSITGSWDATGGSVSTSGLALFTGAGSEVIVSDGESFFNIAFSGAGTWTLEDALDVNGDLTLVAGTLDAKSGENNPITLSGSWITEDGSFTYRSGTVTLDGGDQALSGTGSFFNLTKIVSVARTLSFAANVTQTVFGMLTLNGASGDLLGIRTRNAETSGSEQTPLQTAMVSGGTTCSSGNYNMGYRFYPTADGVITKLGIEAHSDTGDRLARLYECTNAGCTTGTELASVTVTPTGVGSWAYASLGTPVSVTAGQEYVVSVRAATNFFCYRNYATSPDVTSNDIVIMESRYVSGSDTLPTTATESTMYGIADIVFQPQTVGTGTGKLVLDAGGSMSLEYLDVADNDARGGQTLVCLTANGCTDGGGTTNWRFEEEGGGSTQFFWLWF